MRPVVGYSLVLALAAVLAPALSFPRWAAAVAGKPFGGGTSCSWQTLLSFPVEQIRLQTSRNAAAKEIALVSEEPRGIQVFKTSTREIAIPRAGEKWQGKEYLAFAIAEQRWIASLHPDQGVRPGDVVVDVGAHVGTFGDYALRRGASRIVMVEPDPVNVGCIQKNFAAEIADGRVVVVPEGAWDTVGTLDFSVGQANSGTGSLVRPTGTDVVKVRVRPLDDILRSIGVDRVDFIKMDIEGAERHALKGMARVLKTWKPRLMIDSYHLPDDDVVLPALVSSLNPSYRPLSGPCGTWERGHKFMPYVVFYE